MKTPPFIITIGRQFGSGGRELGQRLSEMLDIAYYDKELITEASKESGIASEYFEKTDEQSPISLINALATSLTMSGGAFGSKNVLSGENIFKFQSDIIREVAKSGSCVIVGRCADYILRDNPLCISLFISSNEQDRTARAIRCHEAETPKQALEMMRKADHKRANYYDFYTDKQWGDATSYNLCIDSSLLGIEKTASVVRCYIEQRIASFTEICSESSK